MGSWLHPKTISPPEDNLCSSSVLLSGCSATESECYRHVLMEQLSGSTCSEPNGLRPRRVAGEECGTRNSSPKRKSGLTGGARPLAAKRPITAALALVPAASRLHTDWQAGCLHHLATQRVMNSTSSAGTLQADQSTLRLMATLLVLYSHRPIDPIAASSKGMPQQQIGHARGQRGSTVHRHQPPPVTASRG